MKGIMIFLCLAVIGFCSCANTNTQVSPPIPATENPTTEKATGLTGEWSGHTSKTTAPFEIASIPWIVNWSFQANEPYGLFTVILCRYGKETAESIVATASGERKFTSDTTYLYEKGTFYFQITCVFGEYNIEVIGK